MAAFAEVGRLHPGELPPKVRWLARLRPACMILAAQCTTFRSWCLSTAADTELAIRAGGSQLTGPLACRGCRLGIHSHQQGRAASLGCSPAAMRAAPTGCAPTGHTHHGQRCGMLRLTLWTALRLSSMQGCAESQPCVAVSEHMAQLERGGGELCKALPNRCMMGMCSSSGFARQAAAQQSGRAAAGRGARAQGG